MSLEDLKKQSPAPQQPHHSHTKSPVKRKRSLAWLLPVGLLLGFFIIISLLFGKNLIPATEVRTAPVITIRAEKKPELPKTTTGKGSLAFQASGWIEPDPYIISVPTLTNGFIETVQVLEGQTVKKGQLLATLISEDAELDHETAQKELISMGSRITAHCSEYLIILNEIKTTEKNIEALTLKLEEARDNSRRLAKLSQGTVSDQQIFQAQLNVRSQKAELEVTKTELPRLQNELQKLLAEKNTMVNSLDEYATKLKRAELALDRTKIHAPIDGKILRLYAAPGMKRMANMDSPDSALIVDLYDPKKLQARIDVPLDEAAALTIGQSVELVSDLLPNQTLTGKVTRISGEADLQRNTLQAKVQIENPEPRLRPGMLVRAKFFSITQSTTGPSGAPSRLSIYVPETALISETQVWVVSPKSTAEKRTITLSQHSKDGHRQVLKGLRSGENVILPPHQNLKQNMRISTPSTR